MGGRSLDIVSSQAMYRALETAPFLASGMLLSRRQCNISLLLTFGKSQRYEYVFLSHDNEVCCAGVLLQQLIQSDLTITLNKQTQLQSIIHKIQVFENKTFMLSWCQETYNKAHLKTTNSANHHLITWGYLKALFWALGISCFGCLISTSQLESYKEMEVLHKPDTQDNSVWS